ncbi:MAG: 3-hydroxyacyl-CoA dehydrogenase family protein [Promethearchaeota archaeon]|nr:MAG: 3-hydroxyacyl-CoA dehydrogenase family protein [Candidatus Lokiarchaeota archaeon]
MNLDEIEHIVVVGAGTMGHAIAQVYAQHGFRVDLVDKNLKALERANKLIKSNLSLLIELEKITSKDLPPILNKINFTSDLESSAQKADLVVEAVNEVANIKEELFEELNQNCREDTILASNTSGLNIFEIVDVQNPERLIIHHWFCPAYILPLVEIVPGSKTSKEVIDVSVGLMEKLGKKPLVMKEYVESFIINRIQRVIFVQVYEMLQKGWATPEQIDFAVKTIIGVRFPVQGVVQSQDFTGLELILDKQKEYKMNKRYPQVENLVKQGHLGVRTGKGFYDYHNRDELELFKKRDKNCIKVLDLLEKINAFEPL